LDTISEETLEKVRKIAKTVQVRKINSEKAREAYVLHYRYGFTYATIREYFRTEYDIDVTIGGIQKAVIRYGDKVSSKDKNSSNNKKYTVWGKNSLRPTKKPINDQKREGKNTDLTPPKEKPNTTEENEATSIQKRLNEIEEYRRENRKLTPDLAGELYDLTQTLKEIRTKGNNHDNSNT